MILEHFERILEIGSVRLTRPKYGHSRGGVLRKVHIVAPRFFLKIYTKRPPYSRTAGGEILVFFVEICELLAQKILKTVPKTLFLAPKLGILAATNSLIHYKQNGTVKLA